MATYTVRSTVQPASSQLTLTQLIRWSGWINIIAGMSYMLETLFHPLRDPFNAVAMIQKTVWGVPWSVVHIIGIIAFMTGALGLIALYLRQMGRIGWLGLWGFLLSFIGQVMGLGVVVPDAFLFPVFATNPSTLWLLDVPGPLIPSGQFGVYLILTGVIFVVGTLLFSAASIRARVLPSAAFWLLAVGIPLVTFGPLADNSLGLIGAVLGGVGYIWLGWALWQNPKMEALR